MVTKAGLVSSHLLQRYADMTPSELRSWKPVDVQTDATEDMPLYLVVKPRFRRYNVSSISDSGLCPKRNGVENIDHDPRKVSGGAYMTCRPIYLI